MSLMFELGWMDYVSIALMFVVSGIIGVGVRFIGEKKQTPKQFLMAGGDTPMLPVVLSIAVSIMSSIELLGSSELYRYGTQLMVISVGLVIGIILSSYIFVPVYFNIGVSSVHEFLDIRFGRKMQYAISALFITQMIFFMSAVLCGSVLALSSVTNISMEVSIVIIGLVCTFYCSMGGLKAVLWTDVFQALLMFIGALVIYFWGISEANGIQNVFKRAYDGGRLQFFNFNTDFTERYTFWNVVTRGLVSSMSYYGCSQIQVQRMLSLSTTSRAKRSLIWSILPVVFLLLTCQTIGIILYAIFADCDPILNGKVTGLRRPDQLVPYYIISRLGQYPGLAGLCVSGVFSGALSTISSALNSLATVTIIDFIKPLYPREISENNIVRTAKALSITYGLICIGFTFLIANYANSLLAVTHTLNSIVAGPILAVFLIGVLTRKANEKCALFGLIVGVSLTSFIGFGIVFSRFSQAPMPTSVSGCAAVNMTDFSAVNPTSTLASLMDNETLSTIAPFTSTSAAVNIPKSDPLPLFKISFMWVTQIGCVAALLSTFLAVLVTGWDNNVIPATSKCLSPITRFWIYEEVPTKYNEKNNVNVEEKVALNNLNIKIIKNTQKA